MIKKFCGADDKDALIFCGTGATTAINLLTNQMGVKNQVEYVKAREKMCNILSPEQLALVFEINKCDCESYCK